MGHWRRAGAADGQRGTHIEEVERGASLGFSNSSDARQRWGVFVYALKLGNGRSLSLGQTKVVYDAAAARWKNLQVGLKFAQIFTLAANKWEPSAEVDHDFRDTSGNARWTIRIGITALVLE